MKHLTTKERGSNMAEIYYTDEYTDENGKQWLSINGDTHYPLDQWSKEEAIEDYLSPEAEEKRQEFFYRAWGFYD